MMRQRLEFDAGRSLRRMRVVGDEIAPPDLQRVHADLLRGQFDQTFCHRSRNRMADRAVLAHHVLVLEHHARAGAIVRAGVGPAGEVDHLVRLDTGGARIDRVGADAGEVVDLPGGNGAVLLHADPRLDAVIAGVDVGDEALDPVGDELDRPLEQPGERHRRHLVGVGVDLYAERAADVLGDDADLMFFEAKMLGEQVLHHVRRLRRVIRSQPLLTRVPVSHNGAGLVANAGVAAEHEGVLDHRVRILEARLRIAGDVDTLEAQVVAEIGVDQGSLGVQRCLHVGERLQFFVFDLHQLAGILGLGACARHHGADRLALPARAADRDGVLRRRLDALEMCEHADPRCDDFGQFFAGDNGDDARRLLCGRRIDALDVGVGVRRAHERHVRHPRQHHVADELRAALREPSQVWPRYRTADVGIRTVERGEGGGVVLTDFHFLPPRACATASIASTMAW